MKEYKVEVVESSKKAELIMNQMAKENWEVKTMVERTAGNLCIAFERDK